ncbi:MAG: ribosomal protein S6--L-glutamate ligase [Psychromonas sp.]|jgi:ribosomal protein S6--L-glutamate ligase|uniref:ATP-grasp domain-containing protein n=1 Tax=Psychromonas sp. TaxID=1884585 RepID=UPI0039E6F5A5
MSSNVNIGSEPTVGMWLYKNCGGVEIQQKLIDMLAKKGIKTITDLNLGNSCASGGEIICNGINMESLDAFFSYNAGEQSAFQLYMYQLLNQTTSTLNNYDAFALTEDKFLTAHALNHAGIRTAEYRMIHRDDISLLKKTVSDWQGQVVYKPTDGWGGNGLVKIEDERALDVLIPFLNRMGLENLYLEKYINYDKTDWRVDIVNGEFVGCYGRSAPEGDWRTNITSGGSILLREPNDDVIELAIKAANVTGLEIAGVDLLYDLDAQEYVVLEVNGIPAFATPEQEKIGLNFNQLKINKIADLIESIVEGEHSEKSYTKIVA